MNDKPQVFGAYAAYYDAFYSNKNYAAEAEKIIRLLRRSKRDCSELLELGCGTGGHAIEFIKSGFKLVGVDISEQMIAVARKVKGFEALLGDIRTVRLNRRFDAAISLFDVMSYQTTNSDLRLAFKTASAHISVGGLFIFDCWYTAGVYAQKPEVRVKRITNCDVNILRIAEPTIDVAKNLVEVKYTIYVQENSEQQTSIIEETHLMRHYTIPELELIGEQEGFSLASATDLNTEEEITSSTWKALISFVKIK